MARVKRSNAVDAAVGARIRNLRYRNKLSQTEVGEHVGVTFQQIQKYENGTNRVSAGRLSQLAKLFGVPIRAFYSEAAPSNGEKTRRANLRPTLSDANVDRLVKAFQTLTNKTLKFAILEVAEEMVRSQRRKEKA